MGIVGQHDYCGVDNISVSHDGTLLASCALEEVVHFWNIEYLFDLDNEESKKVSGHIFIGSVLFYIYGGAMFPPLYFYV